MSGHRSVSLGRTGPNRLQLGCGARRYETLLLRHEQARASTVLHCNERHRHAVVSGINSVSIKLLVVGSVLRRPWDKDLRPMQSGPAHGEREAITGPTENQSSAENFGAAPDSAEGTEAAGETSDGNQLPAGSSQEIRAQPSRPPSGRNRRRGWSAIEISTLVLLHAVYGNKWSVIARHFRNRHDGDVKNIFHSALRSKAADANSLLRAYAQAVGPNCDDPRARQTAYEAARQQYGSAPVLCSAAPYMHLPALSSPDGKAGADAGARGLPSAEEADPGPGPGPGGEATDESDSAQQQERQPSEQQLAAEQDDDPGGVGVTAPPSATPGPAQITSPRRSFRLAQIARPMGPAQTDNADPAAQGGRDGRSGGVGDAAPPICSPCASRDIPQQLRSRSLPSAVSEPGAASVAPVGAAAELQPHPGTTVEPRAELAYGPADWRQRLGSAPTPSSTPCPAQLTQQQHQEQRQLQQLQQQQQQQQQQLLLLQLLQEQELQIRQQQQQHQQRLTQYLPSSMPHAPISRFYGSADNQPQPQPTAAVPPPPQQQQQQQRQQPAQQAAQHQLSYTHHTANGATAMAGLHGGPGWAPSAAGLYGNMALPHGTLGLQSAPGAPRIQTPLAPVPPPTPPPALIQGLAPPAAVAAPLAMTLGAAAADTSAGGASARGLSLGLGPSAAATSYPHRSTSGDGGAGSGISLGFGGHGGGALELGGGGAGRLRLSSTASMRDPDFASLADGGGGASGPPLSDPLEALLRDLDSPFTGATTLLGRARPLDSNPHRQFRRPRLPVESLGLPAAAPLATAAVDGRLPGTTGLGPPPPLSAALDSAQSPLGMWPSGHLLLTGPPRSNFPAASSLASFAMYDTAQVTRSLMPPPGAPTAAAVAAAAAARRMPPALFQPGAAGGSGGGAAAFPPFSGTPACPPAGAGSASQGGAVWANPLSQGCRVADTPWHAWTSPGAASPSAAAATATAVWRQSSSPFATATAPAAFGASKPDGFQQQIWASAPQQQQQQQQLQLQQMAWAAEAVRGTCGPGVVPTVVQLPPTLRPAEFGQDPALSDASAVGHLGFRPFDDE